MTDKNQILEKHDKRYHPEGYTEGDTCKYRDGKCSNHFATSETNGDTENLKKPESIDTRYFENLIKDVSTKDIEGWLRDEIGVDCFHAERAEDLRRKLFTTEELKFVFSYGGKSLSKESYNLAVRTFGATIKALKQKNPNFYLANQIFIPWNWMEKEGAIGKAQNDARRGNFTEPYLSVGDLRPVFEGDYISDSYCPNQKLYPYAIVRHEIGHSLSTDEVFRDFSDAKMKVDRRIRDAGLNPLSEWGKWFAHERIANDVDEIIAEIFQRTFAPDYDQQKKLPLGWTALAKRMIDGATRIRKPIGAQDSMESEMPFFNPLYQMCTWTTAKVSNKKNQWWDKATCQWVVFDDDKSADMLRYAASRIKIPVDSVEKLINTFPNRTWSEYDCNTIVSTWWRVEDPFNYMVKHCNIYSEAADIKKQKGKEEKDFFTLWEEVGK